MKFIIFFLFSLIFCAEKADVYFTRTISPEKMVEMFDKLNVKLKGNVGLKVHSGEPDGPYFLRPNFLQKIYEHTNGTFLECNVAYSSKRINTDTHKQTKMEEDSKLWMKILKMIFILIWSIII